MEVLCRLVNKPLKVKSARQLEVLVQVNQLDISFLTSQSVIY
jgi:hypothetical protein